MAEPAADRLALLRRGISITGWFRYPGSLKPAALRDYMSDPAIADLRAAGFSFVRLAVEPLLIQNAPERVALVVDAVRRLQRTGLAVVIDAHPDDLHLEASTADREVLRGFWATMATALRPLDQRLTLPELLNEPVFAEAPVAWRELQDALLRTVRATLPDATIILTGHDWGSLGGLLAMQPGNDPNVVYSFHFYEPAELTALAAYRPGVDRSTLARLPFPVTPDCMALAGTSDPTTAGIIRFYCAFGWDGARVAERINRAAAWGRRNHTAVLLGEFGASTALASASRLAWLDAVRSACEANGIGWALWGYDDSMGLAMRRPPGRRPQLSEAVLGALGLRTPP